MNDIKKPGYWLRLLKVLLPVPVCICCRMATSQNFVRTSELDFRFYMT
ncbi:MAG: hypothetical protein R3275_13475 [Saprospiraceae bacterium]|nr:hypothetical protein [Saprospiraceae bacterium]